MADAGQHLTLSLSRVGLPCNSKQQIEERLNRAESYYSRFDNVFTGPGELQAGMIRALPRSQSRVELAQSLLIGSSAEMVDRLGVYQELGLDRFILSCNFGVEQSEVLDGLQQFAEEVAVHFTDTAPSTREAV